MHISFVISFEVLCLVAYAYSEECNRLPYAARFDCHPEDNPTENVCTDRGCCWEPTFQQLELIRGLDPGVPPCYYPSDFSSTEFVSNVTMAFGERILLRKSSSFYSPDNISNLTVDLIYETQQRIRFRIYDSINPRYNISLSEPVVTEKANNTDYAVEFVRKPFAIIVTRKSTNITLFNSSVSPLIFEDQFIKISTQLSSPYLYGLGEHRRPFFINVTESWEQLTFWAHDFQPIEDANLYGVHPFHINLELKEKVPTNVHGQFFLNSNAMDIDLQPLPALSYTTIGGIIDLYIFTGPSVEDVIEQYWEVIGRPMLPPFWSLGFHLSRYGYENIGNLRKTIERMHYADFPYDVQWTDIDAMSSFLDFTYDNESFAGLPQLVEDLKSGGQHYVNVLDAGISSIQPNGTYPPYDEGKKQSIFILQSGSNEPIKGKSAAGVAVFPDFTHNSSAQWWTNMATSFYDQIKFDGVCLSTNEPSSMVKGSIQGCNSSSKLDNPPFTPHVWGRSLSVKSLCPSARHQLSEHYNVHSMYGHFQAQVAHQALKTVREKRPFVLSRATFAGSGRFTAHWTGDNRSTFRDMYFSIPDILNFNMFGITNVGADICGFGLDTNEELCTRWMQLGAFYPFMRNNNDIEQKDQDPASFSWETQQIMKQALLMRYSLIPYWYTLHYEATSKSRTIVRPLFFEYINDKMTYSIDRQFLVGSALLVSPNLDTKSNIVSAYLPSDTWYNFSSGARIPKPLGKFVDLYTPIQTINVHVRGGFIIPMQIPGPTLILGRGNPFQLLVALSSSGNATGNLYWDEGDSLDPIETGEYNYFEFIANSSNTLTINATMTGYQNSTMRLDNVKVLGVSKSVKTVTVNGDLYQKFVYNFLDQILFIHGLDLNMLRESEQTITWTTSN